MKKTILSIFLLSLLSIAFIAVPWPSYAGGAQVSIGFNVRVGTPRVWVRQPVWIGPRVHYWRAPVVPLAIVPYYYRIPSVVIVEKTPLYVPPDQTQESYWYYCPESRAYYPYVKSCPGGWLKVVPPTSPPDADPRP